MADDGFAGCGLLLYLLIEHNDSKAPVELCVDATVGDLKAAAHAVGAPEPRHLVLAVGRQDITDCDSTPLSDTGLITNEAVVCVRRRMRHSSVMSCSNSHAVALLEGNEVVGWGADEQFWKPAPDFGGDCVTSICAGKRFTAAIAGGKLHVWGVPSVLRVLLRDSERLHGRELVACAASGVQPLIAVVDIDCCVHMCGNGQAFEPFPARLQGSVAAVVLGFKFVAALTNDGDVVSSKGAGMPYTTIDTGGKRATQISAGYRHCSVLLEDGSVRCFGANNVGQCIVPSGLPPVVTCSAGRAETVAVCEDGTLHVWGSQPQRGTMCKEAGPYAAACAADIIVAATTDGRLQADWRSLVPTFQPFFCSVPDLGDRRIALHLLR